MRKENIIAVVLIVSLGLGIYANSPGNGFVWDDKYVLVDNSLIKKWSNISDLFSRDYFKLSMENSYRPVATLSYFINYSLWGLNAFGYHLVNILLHILNAVLLYFLLLKLMEDTPPLYPGREVSGDNKRGRKGSLIAGYFPYSILLALLAALFFVSHPVQGEVVNTISYGEDILCAVFFFLSLLFYRYQDSSTGAPIGKGRGVRRLNNSKRGLSGLYRKEIFIAVSLLCFLVALFSKEMAATLPLILILFDLVKRKKIKVKSHLPYWIALVVYLLVRFVWMRNPHPYPAPYLSGSFLVGLFTMPGVIIYYFKILVWPVGLCADYLVYPASITGINTWFSLILLLIVFVIVLVSYRYSRIFFLAGMWFFITLLPITNIVPLINFMAERYLYLPSVGFCLLGALVINELSRIKRFHLFYAAPALFGGLILFYSIQTATRNPQWRNELTYYRAVLKRSPSARAHNNLGNVYSAMGLSDKALAEYKEAIRLNPEAARAHNNLGMIYFERGNISESIKEYKEALKVEPDTGDIHFNIALAYHRMGQLEEALFEYGQTLRYNPQDQEAHFRRGVIYSLDRARQEKAEKEFEEILRINPANADAYNELGFLRAREGDYRQAGIFWEKALEIDPKHKRARENLEKVRRIISDIN